MTPDRYSLTLVLDNGTKLDASVTPAMRDAAHPHGVAYRSYLTILARAAAPQEGDAAALLAAGATLGLTNAEVEADRAFAPEWLRRQGKFPVTWPLWAVRRITP